jgi:hypothetical protein
MRNIITYNYKEHTKGKNYQNCTTTELLPDGVLADLATLEKIHPNYNHIELVETRVMKY